MASNYCDGGTTDKTVVFSKPVKYLNISVGAGVTFSFSVDGGANYIAVPAGFFSIPVGLITEVRVSSTGVWGLIAVQG